MPPLTLNKKEMPRVLNFYKDEIPSDAIYIGRGHGSKWGNPYVIGRDGSRDEVIEKYCHWICDNPKLMADLPELVGHDLVCFCSPQNCHGHVLLILIEGCVTERLRFQTLNLKNDDGDVIVEGSNPSALTKDIDVTIS